MKIKGIAEHLGMTERWVRELINKGIFKKNNKDELTLSECIQAYISYRIELELKKSVNSEGEVKTLREEETRLKKAQADDKEFDLAVKLGKYVEISVLKKELVKAISNCKAKLLSLPRKAAPQVQNYKSVYDIEEFLRKLVCEALDELMVPVFDEQGIIENLEDDLRDISELAESS